MHTIKIIGVFAFTLLLSSSPAQPSAFTQYSSPDSIFDALDKSYISTGILYDRVYPISKIEQFDGFGDAVCGLSQWRQMYYEIYRASFQTPSFPTIETIIDRQIAAQLTTNNAVPLTIMNFKYNTIKEYTLDSSLLTCTDEKCYDTA